MDVLCYETLKKQGYTGYLQKEASERIVQFGEGNFLRAFVDYFVDVANEHCDFHARVAVVQPIAHGRADDFVRQNNLYTHIRRGRVAQEVIDESRIISCISRVINPYEDFSDFLALARIQVLRYIVSNTTEAGIVYDAQDRFDDAPQNTFPGKLTRFMYERFTTLGREQAPGFIILACELIDDNAMYLKQYVLRHADDWQLEPAFIAWLETKNLFCSTLVDRITTGYPALDASQIQEKLGYTDALLDVSEPFGLWVIEGPETLADELPFARANLPVHITDDHHPYKQRKVRILNGAHTTLVPVAFLSGLNTVGESMNDRLICSFLHDAVYEEIIPTLTLAKEELDTFAGSVFERFSNPFIEHKLLDIALNGLSKWIARVLPSVLRYAEIYGTVPKRLCFGLAALLEFYHGKTIEDGRLLCSRADGGGYSVRDEASVLQFFAKNADLSAQQLSRASLGDSELFGQPYADIPAFISTVGNYLENIRTHGMRCALEKLGRGEI